nr:hypothetical protein [Tanacetum cinerariifolium]
MMIYLRNVVGFKMDHFKGMAYDDIHPIFEKKFNSNVAFLQKTKEQMDEEDSRALKRLRKQKLDEEVEELRKHLMIVPNDDDDVYIKATPLTLKVPIVDYEIYTENKKPYYKIKKADERKYPFTRFTLDQMLNNVRLEVEEESEVSLELLRLSARVESSKDEEGLGDQEDASKSGRSIADIDQDERITLVDDTQERMNDQDMFRVNDLDGDEVVVDVSAGKKEEQSEKVVEKEVSTADPVTTAGEVVTTNDVEVSVALTTTTTDDELTLAETLIESKAAKPKAITTVATIVTANSTRSKEKGIIMQDPSETPSLKPIVSSLQPSQLPQDKDKEEERIAREKDEENIAVIEEWDDVQATIDADRQLAEQLQTQEIE